jgi:hypothetical protein
MMDNLIIHPLVFLDPALLVLLQAQRSMMDGSSTVPTTRRQVRIIGSAEQRGTRKTAFLLTDPNSLCFFLKQDGSQFPSQIPSSIHDPMHEHDASMLQSHWTIRVHPKQETTICQSNTQPS